MAFVVPRNPLTPSHRLQVQVAPHARIVGAADLFVWRRAEQIVEDAGEQARAITDGAQAAYEAERERGHREGQAQASQELSASMAEQLVRTDSYYSQVEDQLAALVLQGVRRIIDGYSDHDRVLHTVRSALAAVRNQKQITLRLHPDNLEYVRARTADLLSGYPGIGLLDAVPDGRLAPDCCILESDIGVVEASTQGQLAALETAFRKARGAGA